jgi:HD-GYP domain-containing protein (c-di-GMP phosphodiesterase class II)
VSPEAARPGAAGLVLDDRAASSRAEGRSARRGGLRPRERLAAATVGGTFVAGALALALSRLDAAEVGWLAAALAVAAYAAVSRIEFELSTGSFVPTQLLLVPILFAFPPELAPVLVLAGYVLGSVVDAARGTIHPERVVLRTVDSWHALGPALVLSLAGDGGVELSRWPLYAAALAAQFACELGAVTAYEGIARGVRPGAPLPYMARSWAIDATLAPVGLAVALVAEETPYAIVLVLPLAGLLGVLSRERRARVDSVLELSAAYRGTAFLLGDVVEADDAYTGFHSRDVVDLCVAVAEELGLDAATRRDTELVALLHDVGKIRIPGEIVNKPGPLDDDEWELMKTHTIEGERMLRQVGGLLARVGVLVRSCHERWDGEGDPDGLAGEAIPLVARIVMCCDAFSAMTTSRSYRPALPLEEALAELRRCAGTHFDPAVVDALRRVVARGRLQRPAPRAEEPEAVVV